MAQKLQIKRLDKRPSISGFSYVTRWDCDRTLLPVQTLMRPRQSCRQAARPVTDNHTTTNTLDRELAEDAAYGEAKLTSAMEDRRGPPHFGTLLRRYRLAAGLSQEALAERARMSIDGISALERGYRRTPQRQTLELLAGALALDEDQREEFEATAARPGLPRRLGGASVTVGPWAETMNSNLPLALKNFVGRETQLDEIIALVHDHRLVTLVGVGGLGKTETALQVGRALNDSTDTAVCLVELAPVTDPSLVVTAIASALGVQEVPARSLLATLAAYLKNKALLLILDNCEQVITDAAEVAETILRSCARVRILATSRESLRATGERSYRLPSLSAHEALALFSDRARAVDHRFALTDDSTSIVAELCRHLDGIPLAIELAAARVNQLSPQALAEKLENRFCILAGSERTARARQQTMRATIDWSYDLLSAQEQRVFERLSVFAGGCTLATATTVCVDEEIAEEDVLVLLSSLVDKSLVVVDFEGSEPRYRLLESFRQYAREKLAARGEQDAIEHRHAVAYLELAKRLDRAYRTEEQFLALAHAEVDNLRAVLQWALVQRRNVLLGQRLVWELRALWGAFAEIEGRRWLTYALELVDEQTPPSVLARLSHTEALIAAQSSEYDVTLVSSRSAIAFYRIVGDSLGVARAQDLEAGALFQQKRFDEARSILQEALPVARNACDRRLIGEILSIHAVIAVEDGDLVASRGYLAEALPHFESSKLRTAWAMITLSGIESRAGNTELALRHAMAALATFRSFNVARGVACALDKSAEYLVSLGRCSEAEASAREALDVALEHRLDARIVQALQKLAAVAALRPQSEGEQARSAYMRAARILGFVDVRLAAITGSEPRDLDQQPEYDRILAALRDGMGADATAKLMAEGGTMTEEQVVAEALG